MKKNTLKTIVTTMFIAVIGFYIFQETNLTNNDLSTLVKLNINSIANAQKTQKGIVTPCIVRENEKCNWKEGNLDMNLSNAKNEYPEGE